MYITGLATTTCLAVYVSGAAVFRYPGASGKRQGHLLDDLGLAVSESTRTTVYLSATTSIPTADPHTMTTTRPSFPTLGDILSPPDSPTTTSSSTSSMVTSTSPSTPIRTQTSSLKSAVVLSTPIATPTVSLSKGSTVSDMTWKPTTSPSATSSALASAASASSTWKTVGIAVSVVTLIGLTTLLIVFFEQWTAFVRDVFLCRHSRGNQDPLGDEEFLPDKHYENYDSSIGSHSRTWAREIRESARLSNIRYPTDVFYGDGSTLGPGKAGIGAGAGAGRRVGEFGQLDHPSRPSFLQRLSMLSLRSPSPVSPRLRIKGHSAGI